MNKIAIFLLTLFFILPAYGQEDKNVIYKVAVGEFGYSSQQHGHKYPWTGSIAEGVAIKKDKQKEVYVDLGSVHRMYKDAKLIVYSVRTVAGRESRSEIGTLKVEEVQAEDLSLCKVTHGGNKIKQAIDAGETLIVTTNTK